MRTHQKNNNEEKAIINNFKAIINCRQCSGINNILCDDNFNLPQPGYVGKNYAQKRVLLIAQNPGDCQPGHKLFDQAQTYARIIKQFSDDIDKKQFDLLNDFLAKFIPTWPLFNKIPLNEAGITINDIAYINLIHCRTFQNKSVPVKCARNCIETHFMNTLNVLKPNVVISLGKWANDRVSNILTEANIPHSYINRLRNLSSEKREVNKKEVISLIKEYVS